MAVVPKLVTIIFAFLWLKPSSADLSYYFTDPELRADEESRMDAVCCGCDVNVFT